MVELNLQDKADMLKQYENYGYQIAYYLLEDESLAAAVASEALIELFQDEHFFRMSPPQREQQSKKTFILHSLSAKCIHR